MGQRRCVAYSLLISAAIGWGAIAPALAVDLGQRYPATLDFSAQQQEGCPWTSKAQDIWRLKEFRCSLQDKFAIELGPSQVVFGVRDTNVLWAVVIPDAPGEIVRGEAGQGEHITSIWMRFHPARVGELFTAATVEGQGDAGVRPLALRVAAQKMHASFQAGNLPLIPPRQAIVVDMETREGPRRFYCVRGLTKDKLEYLDAFRTQPLATPKAIEPQTAQAAFDKVWDAFDKKYAMFVIKPNVDWAKLRDTYRPRAVSAKDNHELAAVLAKMLAHLEDLHVYVQVDGVYVPGFNRKRPLNANREALKERIGPITRTGHDLDWGRTGDGIGYINIYQLADGMLPEVFDEVLGEMADTKGLIIDLRFNGGGSEPLGCEVAGRLLDQNHIYSWCQVRNGPKHTDLTPKESRVYGAAGPWHYVGPVMVLQGQKTMSSAESFALILAQCPQVTTLGDRTAGASGNPRRVDAGAGILVNLPQWIDLDPQGKPFEVIGIPPQVRIDAKPEDFAGSRDPVLEAALERLRSRPTAARPATVLERRPGTFTPQERPRVISVFPPPNASGVDPVTELRIRFDRPMEDRKSTRLNSSH